MTSPQNAAPTGPHRAGRTDWAAVAMALAAGIIVAMQVGKVPPALPMIRDDLGIDLVTAGWVASILNAIGACLGALAGALVYARRPRTAVLAGLALLLVGGVLGALSASGFWLLAARFVEGIGLLGAVVAAPRLIVASAAARDRGLAMGIWGAWMPAGMAIAMLVAAYWLDGHGWRGLWWLNAALVLAFLPAFAWFTRATAPPPARRGVDWAGFRATCARPGPWLLGMIFGVYSLQWFAMMIWLPTLLIDEMKLTGPVAALLAAAVVATNVLGNLAAAAAMHRGVRRPWLIAAGYVAMAATAVGLYAPDAAVPLKLLLAFGFSLLSGLLPAATLAGTAAHAPSAGQVGAVNGIAVQGANLGNLLGPPAMAAVVAAAGWSASYWVMLIGCAAGLGLTAWLALVERRLQE
ncbi:MAG: MFS transporter [Alphaproteobacteria bacterium]